MKASRFWSKKQAKVKATVSLNAESKAAGWKSWDDFNNEIEDMKTFLRARGSYVLNHRLLYEYGKAIIIFYPGHARLQDLINEMAIAFSNTEVMFEEKERVEKKRIERRQVNEPNAGRSTNETVPTEFTVDRQESEGDS